MARALVGRNTKMKDTDKLFKVMAKGGRETWEEARVEEPWLACSRIREQNKGLTLYKGVKKGYG